MKRSVNFCTPVSRALQEADELTQHASQRKQQRFGAMDLRFEFEPRVILRRQSIGGARIGRGADEAVEIVAHLGPETFRYAIARQSHQQPHRADARRFAAAEESRDPDSANSRDTFSMRARSAATVRDSDAHASASQQRRAFQRRRDAQLIAIGQLAQLGFQLFDELAEAAEQTQARADLQP